MMSSVPMMQMLNGKCEIGKGSQPSTTAIGGIDGALVSSSMMQRPRRKELLWDREGRGALLHELLEDIFGLCRE